MYKEDSVYKEVVRPEYPELKLKVPKSMAAQLPYKVRKAHETTRTKQAVIANEQESDIMAMIKQTKAIFAQKQKEKAAKKKEEEDAKRKAQQKEEEEKLHKRTLRKKEFFKFHPTYARK